MVKKHKEIYKCNNGNIYMWNSNINDSMYYFSGENLFEGAGNFKKPTDTNITEQEKNWFLYCIKIKNYITFKEFKNKTQIYELW